MNYVANAAEFYYQNSHPSRSGAAEIHKLEFRLSNLLASLVLRQHSFEHWALVAKIGSRKDAALEKFSGKTVIDTADGYRGKGEVVALDTQCFEAKRPAVVELYPRWRKSTESFGVQIYAAEIRKSVAMVSDDPERAIGFEARVLLGVSRERKA